MTVTGPGRHLVLVTAHVAPKRTFVPAMQVVVVPGPSRRSLTAQPIPSSCTPATCVLSAFTGSRSVIKRTR